MKSGMQRREDLSGPIPIRVLSFRSEHSGKFHERYEVFLHDWVEE